MKLTIKIFGEKMSKPQIMIISTSRADYGLLYPLIKKLLAHSGFVTNLVVTGSHLSDFHGLSIKKIEEDGIPISFKVKASPESDTEDGICTLISEGITNFSNLFTEHKPDLIMVLGDRYELMSACLPAMIHKIPIAHLHGGEQTVGVIDDAIRNAITKMSSIHFASLDLYAKRIIQMGERSSYVFTVGAIGLDNIKDLVLYERKELSDYTGINFNEDIALLTYHPLTLDHYDAAAVQMQEVLQALMQTDLKVLITMPNADTGYTQVFSIIEQYLKHYPEKFNLVKNLGQKGYLSTLKYAKLMVGNSSSGIIESPSFKIPVVNIGDRQQGRYRARNVIDCECSQEAIVQSIQKALSTEFRSTLSDLVNPYGDGTSATKIINCLEKIDLLNKAPLLKKGFVDSPF